MHIVLLSGGSGKRLWPLSNDSRSKQFLRVLPIDGGTNESMLQRVWGQLKKVGLDENVYIATRESQKEIIYNQLGDVPLILEPERRDTFPAITLAVSYLKTIVDAKADEVVCFIPVDAFVEEHFYRILSSLDEVLTQSKAQFALVGIEPTYPSEKFGYIVPKKSQQTGEYIWAKQFVEKPDRGKAEELIEQNAYWNGGVFASTMGNLEHIFTSLGISLVYDDLLRGYQTLKKISFDYEVIEKSERVVFIPYKGKWKDLGTWNTLSEEMGKSIYGNGILSENTSNSHIINELKLPVVVIGLSDIIVAVSSDGILVSKKCESHQVKDVMIDGTLPQMYEEREWGWTRVLDYSMKENPHWSITQKIGIFAEKLVRFKIEKEYSKSWTVISGEGRLNLRGKPIHLSPGITLTISKGIDHVLLANTEIELIEILLK